MKSISKFFFLYFCMWIFSCSSTIICWKACRFFIELPFLCHRSVIYICVNLSTSRLPVSVPFMYLLILSCCCCSVTQLCLTLWDPMDCSMPGFPDLHHLTKFAQTHVHWVGDAIQPSISSSVVPFSCFLSFPASGFFSVESVLHISWPEYWNFSFSSSPSNEYSGLISFRIDWLDLPVVSRYSLRSSFTVVRKHQFFGVQPFLLSSSHIWTWLLEKP